MAKALPRILRLNNIAGRFRQSTRNLPSVFIRRKPGQTALCRQFYIDRNSVSIKTRLMDQFWISFGDGFEVNIAAKIILLAQDPRCLNNLLHRAVRAFDNAR